MNRVSSMRCWIGRAVLLLAASLGPVTAWTQDYPTRPIRLIVGFAPGGILDLIARSLGRKLSEAWGQQVIIENRPSAGGVVCMQITAKAAPNGYTLLMASSGQFSITPALRADLPYDVVRDFTPITQVGLTPVILTVLSSHPARSLQELIQLAKAKPDQIMNYGSPGYGGAPHIAGEYLKRVAGIDLTHVPYKGGGDAVAALMGGHVQMSFGAVSTSLPHVRAGKMRALGVTSAKRISAIPEVPTFAEAGLPGFEVVQWYGVFGPQGIPPALTRRLNEALARVLNADQFKREFWEQGVEMQTTTPEALAVYVKTELVKWTKILRDLGIQDSAT